MKNEPQYRYMAQRVVLAGSVLLLLVLVFAWTGTGSRREWKEFGKKIREVDLAGIGRVDRCMTCHTGMEDPERAGEELPRANHPGSYLADHPVSRYGCTLCHGGQGRALSRREAHGKVPMSRWSDPLLDQPYIQSSCGKCHLSIFPGSGDSRESVISGMEVIQEGKKVFAREGCLGCHRARGVGGILGPDLTEQGEKTRHEYNFQYVKGEHTVSNWLKEHFRDPETVSPGSQMLRLELEEDELVALVTFVMGLAKPAIPFDYFDMKALNELKGIRGPMEANQLYAQVCSACHGKNGEGKEYGKYRTGVPGIGRVDFLRVASADYLRFTMEKGRSMRLMGSWSGELSGLTPGELDSLVVSLKGNIAEREDPSPDVPEGDPRRGMESFRNRCEACHGENGKGGIAVELNQDDLLSLASDRYLLNTLLQGRGNTAMPGWSNLDRQELYDLVSYIRSWGGASPAGPESPTGFTPGSVTPEPDPEEGAARFHYLCSRCHGENGEGGTGPAIINRDFLRAASNEFLAGTVAGGRVHTPMFGWSSDLYGREKLEQGEIMDIIAYLREASAQPLTYVYPGGNPGDAGAGSALFHTYCAECHGEYGEGTRAPALNNQELLSAASNGYLLATITLGRDGTPMPAWGYGEGTYPRLSGKERQDLVAYLRSWQRIRIHF